jgi:hypothetical protein
MCVVIDHVVNGVATSGRLISADPSGAAESGSFYLDDGSVTSSQALVGTYVLRMQGTSINLNSGNPEQNIALAALTLDGQGNVSGGMADVQTVSMTSGGPEVVSNSKLPVTGNYFYNPYSGSGVLALTYNNQHVNLAFYAATARHLLIMTNDGATTVSGNSTEPVFFGDAQLRAAGPLSAATLTGNVNMKLQGLNTFSSNSDASNVTGGQGVIAEAGSFLFDGNGRFVQEGAFSSLNGQSTNSLGASERGGLRYTVDPTSGRFESLNPSTHQCLVCGYLVGPGEIDTVVTLNGMPMYAAFESAAAAPEELKMVDLNGAYSFGSTAVISPMVAAWDGVLRADGKGNFEWSGTEADGAGGLNTDMHFGGTYKAANGAFALTVTGRTQPDFFVYLDANGHGSMIPVNATNTGNLPLLDLNAAYTSAVQ